MIVGDKVFFTDLKKKAVLEGIIYGITVSSTGYILYGILCQDGSKTTKERACVFTSLEEAQQKLPQQIKIHDEMEAILKESQSKMDALRLQIIGNPEVPQLAEVKHEK